MDCEILGSLFTFSPELDDQVASNSKNTHTGKCNLFFLDEGLATICIV